MACGPGGLQRSPPEIILRFNWDSCEIPASPWEDSPEICLRSKLDTYWIPPSQAKSELRRKPEPVQSLPRAIGEPAESSQRSRGDPAETPTRPSKSGFGWVFFLSI